MLVTAAANAAQRVLSQPQRVASECRSKQQAAVPAAKRRHLLGAALGVALLSGARQAGAVGLESIELPPAPQIAESVQQQQDRNRATLEAAEDSFQKSDLLRTLKERSETNKAQNRKALQNKYCARQAELGIGDCGGLRFIPGMTQRLRREGLSALENQGSE